MMIDLSAQDRRLLSALKQDARASVTQLAQIVGQSRATVQARMERLLASGVIQRFTVEVSPVVDFELIRAVMMIEVEGVRTREVIRHLGRMKSIASLHSTNGTWDLVAHVETASLPEFDQVLREVREIRGVLNSQTSLLLNSVNA